MSWTSSEGSTLQLNPVTVSNGVLYTTSMNAFLTARDAKTGVVLSKQPLGWGTLGGVAVSDGTVFAVTGTTGAPGVDSGGSGFVVAFRPAG